MGLQPVAGETMVGVLKNLQQSMVEWRGAGVVKGALLVGGEGLTAWRQVGLRGRHVGPLVPFWGTVPVVEADPDMLQRE